MHLTKARPCSLNFCRLLDFVNRSLAIDGCLLVPFLFFSFPFLLQTGGGGTKVLYENGGSIAKVIMVIAKAIYVRRRQYLAIFLKVILCFGKGTTALAVGVPY